MRCTLAISDGDLVFLHSVRNHVSALGQGAMFGRVQRLQCRSSRTSMPQSHEPEHAMASIGCDFAFEVLGPCWHHGAALEGTGQPVTVGPSPEGAALRHRDAAPLERRATEAASARLPSG